jgi:hypothetical protein
LKETWESSIFYGHIIHPSKPYVLFFITQSDSLEEKLGKAKPSMVASAIPQNLVVKREKRNRARSALLTVFYTLSLCPISKKL